MALLIISVMAVVAGLAIVLAHNVWSGGALPIVVILVSWISLIKGPVFLLLSPETALAYFEALRYGQLFYAYMSVALVIGIYLTFACFRSVRRSATATECQEVGGMFVAGRQQLESW